MFLNTQPEFKRVSKLLVGDEIIRLECKNENFRMSSRIHMRCYDIQHNDTQHNDTQLKDTQHNNKNATLGVNGTSNRIKVCSL
jgi:hypothetical protein